MTGVRERARVHTTDEIKRVARRHLARDGAAGLSLRAVARELDMVSSAVYRYFRSRDELLTALIIDAFDSFGAAAERADAAEARDDLWGRWRATCQAAYRWSRRHPAEYALIFGSPVPGYEAPEATMGPATRFTNVLLGILVDAKKMGMRPRNIPPVSDALRSDIEMIRQTEAPDIDVDWLAVAVQSWTSLMGLITFIRFGHLYGVVNDSDAYFEDMVDRIGQTVVAYPTKS